LNGSKKKNQVKNNPLFGRQTEDSFEANLLGWNFKRKKMEDNNFIEPTVAIYEQQEIRVGNSISEIESNCNTSPLLLSGLNNVKKKGPKYRVDIKQLIGTVLVKNRCYLELKSN
jgi:hypothetical protein